jgi:hypothetical protein
MSKKVAPLRVAPLQYVIAEAITDPAEQAALDKVRKQNMRKKAAPKAKRKRKDTETA